MILLIIAGQLDVPESNLAKWHALSLETAPFADWPQDAPIFTGVSPGTHATVADVLRVAGALDGRPSFLEWTATDVCGLLTPDATTDLHQDLATAFRLAGTVGGKGRIAFVVPGESVALVIDIGEPKNKEGEASDEEADEDAEGSNEDEEDGDQDDDDEADEDDDESEEDDEERDDEPQVVSWMQAQVLFSRDEGAAVKFAQTAEFIQAWSKDHTLSRGEYNAQKGTLGLLPISEQPHHAAILERLSAVDPARLRKAMVDGNVLDDASAPLAKRWPTAASLATALREAQPAARAAGIELLSLVDPEAAFSEVGALLEDPSRQVRRHAVGALGRIAGDAAFDRLLQIDPSKDGGDPFFSSIYFEAVLGSQAPQASKRIEAFLDAPEFLPGAWAKLHRIRDAGARAELAVLATQSLQLVAKRCGERISPRLLRLHDEHPAEEIRVAAAKSILHSRGAEAEARTQDILCTINGMGKALNSDEERRKAILGIGAEDYSVGLLRFDDIDGSQLKTLIDEHFANPATAQNDAPAIGQFLAIMTEHPELRASGYLIPPSRGDYRVSLDGLVCPTLEEVPEERRAAVEELFAQLSETATNTDDEGHALRCWWT